MVFIQFAVWGFISCRYVQSSWLIVSTHFFLASVAIGVSFSEVRVEVRIGERVKIPGWNRLNGMLSVKTEVKFATLTTTATSHTSMLSYIRGFHSSNTMLTKLNNIIITFRFQLLLRKSKDQ